MIKRRQIIELFLISFLGLYLEMLVIRWLSANVRIMAYYTNIVLITSFLGLSIGSLRSRTKINLFYFFPFLIFLQNSKNFHDENINNYYEKLRYFKSELSRIKTLSNEELEKLRDDLYNLSASANSFGKVKKNIADKVSGNI